MKTEDLKKFVLCSEQEPPHGQEVLTWSQEAEDRDEFDGVVIGFKTDDDYWQFAVWCLSCDDWHSRYTVDVIFTLGIDWTHRYWPKPTHWKLKY